MLIAMQKILLLGGCLLLALATTARAQVDSVRAKTLPGKQGAEKAYNAGLASFNARSYPAALRSFDAAIAAKPDFGPAYANRAATRFELKNYAEAAQDYSKALRYEPGARSKSTRLNSSHPSISRMPSSA